jgi:carbonic anhydrase
LCCWHLQTTNPLPAGTTLDISSVLPSDTTHITYPGSLTTPPCTQGVLWHVLQTPQTISRGQVSPWDGPC